MNQNINGNNQMLSSKQDPRIETHDQLSTLIKGIRENEASLIMISGDPLTSHS